MFPLMMPMLLGAGAGALLKKKDPLKGALLGAGLGAAGGAIAPQMGGLLGGANAPIMPVPDGSSLVDLAGTSAAGMGQAPSMGIIDAMKKYKPLMDAAGTGMSVSQQMNQEQPITPASFSFGSQAGPPSLMGLASQGQQGAYSQIAQEEADRQRRKMMRRGILG